MSKIKSNLTTSYMLFVFDFSDPSAIDKKQIESGITCALKDLFHSQRTLDIAKKQFGKSNFAKLLGLYFDQFQSQDGFDFRTLELEVLNNKKVFLRHLGRDKLNYLTLLISLMKAAHEERTERRGLLGVA